MSAGSRSRPAPRRIGARYATRWVSRNWPPIRASPMPRRASAMRMNSIEIINAWTSQRDRWEVTEMLQKAGVAAFPTMTNQDLADDAHLRARGFMVELDHPVVGRRRHAGVPWHMSPSECKVIKPAPLLGADTEDILTSLLGYSAQQVARLREERVLY